MSEPFGRGRRTVVQGRRKPPVRPFPKDGEIMLVLSRKRGEGVMIGQDVEVVVLEIRGDRVKLGFQGPNDVPIHREEVYAQIAAETRAPQAVACH
jgi:carbon storage regulator